MRLIPTAINESEISNVPGCRDVVVDFLLLLRVGRGGYMPSFDWVIYLLVFLVSAQTSVMFEVSRRLIRAERTARENNVAWASIEACKIADMLVKTVDRVDALERKAS